MQNLANTPLQVQKALNRSYIEPSMLSRFQRILLTTDGTLTEILAAYLCEQIILVKLSEQMHKLNRDLSPLAINAGIDVIDRRILLQGKISRRNFIYAESFLVPDRLEEKFKQELLVSQTPLGRLWVEHKLETFKEIIDTAKEPAGALSSHFGISPEEALLSRTYRVFSNREPIMMITEKFPECFFQDNF
jgi:chorismate-pyruvate lyase